MNVGSTSSPTLVAPDWNCSYCFIYPIFSSDNPDDFVAMLSVMLSVGISFVPNLVPLAFENILKSLPRPRLPGIPLAASIPLPEAPMIIGLPNVVGLPIFLLNFSPPLAPNLSILSSMFVFLVLVVTFPFRFVFIIVVVLSPTNFCSCPFLINPVLRVHPVEPCAFVAPRTDFTPVIPTFAPFATAPKPMVPSIIAVSAATSPTTLPGCS